MRAFPPPPPAMLGAVKGEEDQEQLHARLFALARRSALPRLSGPHYIAATVAGNARRGGAKDRADFAACIRTCSQRSPAPDADPERRMRAGRNVLGRVLFGDFLLHEQEKVTRSSAGRVEALAAKTEEQKTGFQLALE